MKVAVVINLVFLALYVVLGNCSFSSCDDFFMSAILTGAYGGEYDVHLYFVNAVYGYFLKPFYLIFPKIGWYYVFEVAEVFASFTVFTYVLLSRLGKKWGVLASCFLLSCLAPVFYFQISFTQNASLLTATGFLLIYLGSREKKKYLVLGVLFTVAGFVMRRDAFLLGVPYFGILLFILYFCEKKRNFVNIICFAISLVAIFSLNIFDVSLYQNDEYRYYAEYQAPRAVFGDGNYYDKEASLDEIEERDLHGVDFSLLTKWVFYDSDVLKKDSLENFFPIISRNKYDVYYSKLPFAIVKEISRSLQSPVIWCWILFALLIICSKNKFCAMPWVTLACVSGSLGYLLLLNRIVSHVEMAIWLYAIVAMIPFLEMDFLEAIPVSPFMKKMTFFSMAIVFALGYWGVSERQKRIFGEDRLKNDLVWDDFLEYEREHPDKVFLFELVPYKEFSRRLKGSYLSITPGRLNHIIPLGYWNVHLPEMERILEQVGIENPMQSFLKENILVVQYEGLKNYQEFYKIHLGLCIKNESLLWNDVLGFDVIKYGLNRYYEKEVAECEN